MRPEAIGDLADSALGGISPILLRRTRVRTLATWCFFALCAAVPAAAQTVIYSKPPDLGKSWYPLSPAGGSYVYADSFVAPTSAVEVVPTRLGAWLYMNSAPAPSIRFEIWSDDNGPDASFVYARTSSIPPPTASSLTYFSAPVDAAASALVPGQRYWFVATVIGESGAGSIGVGAHSQNSVYADNATFWYSNDPDGLVFEGQNRTPEMAFQVELENSTSYFPAGVFEDGFEGASVCAWSSSSPDVDCPPVFPGLLLAAPINASTATLAWLEASDDSTPAPSIKYRIYASQSPDFTPAGGNLKSTVVGDTHAALSGLSAGQQYYVLVLAEDLAGNQSVERDYRLIKSPSFPVQLSGSIQSPESLSLGQLLSSTATRLVYEKLAASSPPTIGSILVGSLGPGLEGFWRKVTAVSITASTIVVTTENSAWDDAISQMDFSSSAKLLDLPDANSVINGPSPVGFTASESLLTDGQRVRRTAWSNGVVELERTDYLADSPAIGSETGVQQVNLEACSKAVDDENLELCFSVDFEPEIETDASWPSGGPHSAKFIARGKLRQGITASYKFQQSKQVQYPKEPPSPPRPVFRKTWTSVYPVGPPPLVVYQKVAFELFFEASLAAQSAVTATTRAASETTLEVGATYDDINGWQPVAGLTAEREVVIDLGIEGAVTAEVRLIPKLSVEFYEAVTAGFSIEPYLLGNLAMQLTTEPLCSPSEFTSFDFGVGLDCNLSLDFTPFHFNFSLWNAEVCSPFWPFFSLPNFTLDSSGSGPVSLDAHPAGGVNNAFDPTSAAWQASPATGTITPSVSDPSKASLSCSSSGQYTVTFKGSGVAAPLKQCEQISVSCAPSGSTPPAPASVAASDGTYPDRIRVSWGSSSGATSYRVFRNLVNSLPGSPIATPASSPYDDTSQTCGDTYYFWVAACNAGNCSSATGPNTGYRLATAPPVPTGLAASDGTYSDKVRVTWNASACANSYQVYRNTANSIPSSPLTTTAGITYDDTSATPGVNYYYWVKSCRGAICSAGGGPDIGSRAAVASCSLSLAGTYGLTGAFGVAVTGSLAFVADLGSGFKIINVSNRAAPTLVHNSSDGYHGGAVAVSGGHYAYLSELYGVVSALYVYDYSDPALPQRIGTQAINDDGRDVAVLGNYAFVAADGLGLRIFDVSNHSSDPSEIGHYDTPGEARGVIVVGSLAYVADGSAGVQILNISNPAAPSLVGAFNTSGNAYSVALSGSYLYVADGDSGLEILNVSNPSAPAHSGSLNTSGSARDVAVAGSTAYIANYDAGLQVVNVSNPSSPTLLGTYNTPGFSESLAIDGSYAYVADYSSLQIVNIAGCSP